MYIKQKITVRGVRLMKRPHFHNDNQEFLEGWDKLQTENNLRTMQ